MLPSNGTGTFNYNASSATEQYNTQAAITGSHYSAFDDGFEIPAVISNTDNEHTWIANAYLANVIVTNHSKLYDDSSYILYIRPQLKENGIKIPFNTSEQIKLYNVGMIESEDKYMWKDIAEISYNNSDFKLISDSLHTYDSSTTTPQNLKWLSDNNEVIYYTYNKEAFDILKNITNLSLSYYNTSTYETYSAISDSTGKTLLKKINNNSIGAEYYYKNDSSNEYLNQKYYILTHLDKYPSYIYSDRTNNKKCARLQYIRGTNGDYNMYVEGTIFNYKKTKELNNTSNISAKLNPLIDPNSTGLEQLLIGESNGVNAKFESTTETSLIYVKTSLDKFTYWNNRSKLTNNNVYPLSGGDAFGPNTYITNITQYTSDKYYKTDSQHPTYTYLYDWDLIHEYIYSYIAIAPYEQSGAIYYKDVNTYEYIPFITYTYEGGINDEYEYQTENLVNNDIEYEFEVIPKNISYATQYGGSVTGPAETIGKMHRATTEYMQGAGNIKNFDEVYENEELYENEEDGDNTGTQYLNESDLYVKESRKIAVNTNSIEYQEYVRNGGSLNELKSQVNAKNPKVTVKPKPISYILRCTDLECASYVGGIKGMDSKVFYYNILNNKRVCYINLEYSDGHTYDVPNSLEIVQKTLSTLYNANTSNPNTSTSNLNFNGTYNPVEFQGAYCFYIDTPSNFNYLDYAYINTYTYTHPLLYNDIYAYILKNTKINIVADYRQTINALKHGGRKFYTYNYNTGNYDAHPYKIIRKVIGAQNTYSLVPITYTGFDIIYGFDYQSNTYIPILAGEILPDIHNYLFTPRTITEDITAYELHQVNSEIGKYVISAIPNSHAAYYYKTTTKDEIPIFYAYLVNNFAYKASLDKICITHDKLENNGIYSPSSYNYTIHDNKILPVYLSSLKDGSAIPIISYYMYEPYSGALSSTYMYDLNIDIYDNDIAFSFSNANTDDAAEIKERTIQYISSINSYYSDVVLGPSTITISYYTLNTSDTEYKKYFDYNINLFSTYMMKKATLENPNYIAYVIKSSNIAAGKTTDITNASITYNYNEDTNLSNISLSINNNTKSNYFDINAEDKIFILLGCDAPVAKINVKDTKNRDCGLSFTPDYVSIEEGESKVINFELNESYYITSNDFKDTPLSLPDKTSYIFSYYNGGSNKINYDSTSELYKYDLGNGFLNTKEIELDITYIIYPYKYTFTGTHKELITDVNFFAMTPIKTTECSYKTKVTLTVPIYEQSTYSTTYVSYIDIKSGN